ncbi:hypothetical protein PV11_03269 [Exophiala sideris]|uniref:Fe2OG dioxygenase domain-containing protein n=1 Tax=Exophiala sideris TaxID=1016849 RepID=A0A0D1WG50_9EURO|nr:hypothetical protein PV11_03269 [Exophiala sideris]
MEAIQSTTQVIDQPRRLLSLIPDEIPGAPPVIDFSPFYGNDTAAKDVLVKQVRDACLAKGFFQIVNHGIPEDLQQAMFEQSKDFFSLPIDQKEKYDKASHPNKLGYERFRSQNFEGKTAGDLKEGFFFGPTLPKDHPFVQQGRIHCGTNIYPPEVSDPEVFEKTVKQYHQLMTNLATNVLTVVAMTLNLGEGYFKAFCHDSGAVLRLLHYPPQAADASEEERGIGAHTDFGSVTLLLQDDVGGLQVFDKPTMSWIDVKPTPGAYVVNLGNVMMRYSNDTYVSNLHRVINKTGRERYSIPFFFSGNPDFVVDCLPGCEDADGKCKYPPVRIEDWIFGRHTNTFEKGKGVEELSSLAKVA